MVRVVRFLLIAWLLFPPPVARVDVAAERSARRGLEPQLDTLPLTPIPRSHPVVGRLRGRGSLSIGTTRDGFIANCRPLPTDEPNLKQLEVQSHRGTACGTDELVAALVKASRDVARLAPGGAMAVGNVGRVGGGDISWSISHNSGRDADLGFFLLGPDARPFAARDLVRLDANLRGVADGTPVRLDLRRTWLAVRSLLTNPDAEIQWLFVSSPIRKALLEFAKQRKEPPGVQARAEEAMAQPAHTKPHDDHVHLRVYCAPDDLLEGCQDRGTNRPWFVDRKARMDARVSELLALLGSKDVDTRADAATVLGRIGRGETVPRLAALLDDRAATVRIAAARALRDTGFVPAPSELERRVLHAREPETTLALLQMVERGLSGEARAASLGRLLGSNREIVLDNGVFEAHWTIGGWAAAALVRLGGEHAVAALVAALERPGVDPAVVGEALRTLTGADPVPAGTDEVAAAWRGWWARHRKLEPLQWYQEALRTDHGAPDVAGLLDVLRRADWRWRAAASLLRLTLGRAARPANDAVEPLPVLFEKLLAIPAHADGETPASADGAD